MSRDPTMEKLTREEEEEERLLAKAERIRELRRELIGQDLEVDDVVEILALERSTVLRYLREQVIIGYQIGRTYRVPEDELRAYKERLLQQEREEQQRKRIKADVERRYELWVRTQPEKQWAEEECPECGSPMLSYASHAYSPEFHIHYDMRNGSCDVCGKHWYRSPTDEELAQRAQEARRAKAEAEVQHQLEILRKAGREAERGYCDQCGCLALFLPPTVEDIDSLDTFGVVGGVSDILLGTCGNCGHYTWMTLPELSGAVSEKPLRQPSV